MDNRYQKLYAYLVGQMDEALTAIERDRDTVPAERLLELTSFRLKHALREAEEQFLGDE